MTSRLRRLRVSATLRDMLAEVRLSRQDLVAPIFVRPGEGSNEIPTMPGQFQHSHDSAMDTLRHWSDSGIPAVLLFGIPPRKDPTGSMAWDESAPVQRLVRAIKRELPSLCVITDVCLCEYTDHGHCGVLETSADGKTSVDNDATVELLAKTAVSHARAGADIVAPSAMMDNQVSAIRRALDEAGHTDTAILSYAVKFASSLYGPFRQVAENAPAHGDRRTYQMDYRSPRQAILESSADAAQGADMLMVKPAGTCLDVIAEIRRRFDLPLAAYHVSGEYAAIKFAAMAGAIDEKAAVCEITTAIKRAGADIVITYYAQSLASWL